MLRLEGPLVMHRRMLVRCMSPASGCHFLVADEAYQPSDFHLLCIDVTLRSYRYKNQQVALLTNCTTARGKGSPTVNPLLSNLDPLRRSPSSYAAFQYTAQ